MNRHELHEMRVLEIAALVAGEIEGDGTTVIRRAAKIEEAIEGDVTFIADPRYEKYLETTHASAVIVSRATRTVRRDVALVRVDDPFAAFMMVFEKLNPAGEPLAVGVHPTAIIDPSTTLGTDVGIGVYAVIGRRCVIGAGTRIHPHSVLGNDVKVGEHSILYANVTVREKCTIGSRVIIHPGAVVGGDGFRFAPEANGTYRKIPQLGTVVVEDDVEIGSNSTIDRATLGETRICRGVKLDNLVHIAHNCLIGENTIIAAQTGIAGSAKIGKNCVMAGQVGIVDHIEIADRITITAKCGVTKSFLEPGITLFGFPAQDRREGLRQEAALRRLPGKEAISRQLEKRVKDLEARG